MGHRLQINQEALGENRHRVEATLSGPGFAALSARSQVTLTMKDEDRANLRWYLERYLQEPFDPNPARAQRIEHRMVEIGADLFREVFQSSDDARDLWARMRDDVPATRIEVVTDVEEAVSIPWELMRDPKTDAVLALHAQAFVRTQHATARRPRLPEPADGPIRILLVIARPNREDDVPFRSVARRLIESLGTSERFQLDVLRPPTFARLAEVLRAAKNEGKPYHVVHFDGHGAYGERAASGAAWQRLIYGDPRPGPHGYLAFEDPSVKENLQLISGPALGNLLWEAQVPVLALNACRSAHADSTRQSPTAEESKHEDGIQPHEQVRAYGSLAQEIVDAGTAAVIAMRYNVYVVTAAQFVANFYAGLVQGWGLGEAASAARKQLADHPIRDIGYGPKELEDWTVPIVYEAAPVTLFPASDAVSTPQITIHAAATVSARGNINPRLSRPPDLGFFGRDETLLNLDRDFDTHHIVLLHGYAGSGKTSTAAEFARWYAATGGVAGPVLFTSFEQYKPLPQVLNEAIEPAFAQILQQNGIEWLTLTDAERRHITLRLLAEIPVLWIWDNVEPVAGFPTGTESAWSYQEREDLKDFLRDVRQTEAKVLLTSRRDEQRWLGDIAKRVPIPSMRMDDRIAMTRALLERRGAQDIDIGAWTSLLEYTGGNPMTLEVVVGQAVREHLATRSQIEAYVDQLRAGEWDFDDDEEQGRARSLGASLRYGFAHAFSPQQLEQLALLHFFQGFVDVDTLRVMGNPDADWCLPAVRGLTREAGIALLDRAAEIGLLAAHGAGYYSIHPALPWFLQHLFATYYPATSIPGDEPPALRATRAFLWSTGNLVGFYHHSLATGIGADIAIRNLAAEEENMHHVLRLAKAHGWWGPAVAVGQGLYDLYDRQGRLAEMQVLVQDIAPGVTDPDTGGPRPGWEEEWEVIVDCLVRLATRARRWQEAERLLHRLLTWLREQAAPIQGVAPKLWDQSQRVLINNLSVVLERLGRIQQEQGKPECVATFTEALQLAQAADRPEQEARVSFNLGNAYLTIASLQDFDVAEQWYRRDLELTSEENRLDRARSWGQLGTVSLLRFKSARKAGYGTEILLSHLNDALSSYNKALELLPPDTLTDLGTIYHQIGAVYAEAGDTDLAVSNFVQSIRYRLAEGDIYEVGRSQRNVGIALARAGRLAEALEWWTAALRSHESAGAVEEISITQSSIDRLRGMENNI